MRDCSLLPACQHVARSFQARDLESVKAAFQPRFSVPGAARPAAPNEPNAAFKRDGTAMLHDSPPADKPPPHNTAQPPCEPSSLGASPVQVIDFALPAMSEESTPGTPRMQLFFVFEAVQTLPVWILAESGFVRNLIDEWDYNRLPFRPPMRDPGNVQVIDENGEALDFKGFAVLPISLGSKLIWHDFGVVSNLPLAVLVGADVLAFYLCSLLYLKHNRKCLHFGIPVCLRCTQFCGDPEVGTSKQLRFVDNHPKHKRKRLKIDSLFLATLEAGCDNCDLEQPESVEDPCGLSDPLLSVESPSTTSRFDNHPSAKPHDPYTFTCPDKQTLPTVPLQTGKLQQVLANLEIASLLISESLHRRLICVVRDNLDTFAASPTDLGRTSVVVHTIKTGDANPFCHKFSAVPFAPRQYLEQKFRSSSLLVPSSTPIQGPALMFQEPS